MNTESLALALKLTALNGGVAILALTVLGFALWLKAERPLLGIPCLLGAVYVACVLWKTYAN